MLQWTQGFFADKGIDTPRLDAELLLAHALGVQRIVLYTSFDKPLRPEERQVFREYVKRRAQREPVAYILGEREFYGRSLRVAPGVLIPRPETEHLVDRALSWLREQELKAPEILDIGTGTGAIAVSLAAEVPEARLVATDISETALSFARANAEQHGVSDRTELIRGANFEPVAQRRFHLIVSNPPYVETHTQAELQAEVAVHEPAEALFAGADGLDVLRVVSREAPAHLYPGGLLAMEVGAGQAADVCEMLQRAGFTSVHTESDLQGHARVVAGVHPGRPGG